MSNGRVLKECLKAVCRGETRIIADKLINLARSSKPFALRLASTEALSLLTAAIQIEDDDTPIDVSERRKRLYNAIIDATAATGKCKCTRGPGAGQTPPSYALGLAYGGSIVGGGCKCSKPASYF
jgi:hypothetical protein